MRRASAIFFLFAASALAVHTTATAQQQPMIAVQYTSDEMLQALLPQDATRGMAREQTGTPMSGGAPSASVVVAFEPDTDRLTVEGMQTLRALATAMQDPRLQGASFQVVGHGFAQGDPQLQVRTARRAQTVAEHLAGFYNIDYNHLIAYGAGAANPFNAMVPSDPRNDRIEIINISQN